MIRVGMLTSGGDCQSLNATMRGIGKGLFNYYGDGVEIIGFLEGYKGLMYNEYTKLSPRDFSGLLDEGGTILGTSRQPFKMMRVIEDGFDKVAAMKRTYKAHKLDCLCVLGGNGSQKTSALLKEEGLNVLGLPKTIDNDLWGTDMTFGFQSALNIATEAIDCIHTTAASHGRVFIIEVMGHKVGELTLHAGVAGGADIILIPEIPYNLDSVCKAIQKREEEGKNFTIIAMAEGAISTAEAKMKKKEVEKKHAELPASFDLAAQIQEKTGCEVRVTVPGHTQRGGRPCPYDRVLSTRLGAAAAMMIEKKKFGYLVGIHNNEITPVPLEDIAGKLKMVDPKGEVIKQIKSIGISFGDD